MPDEHIDPPCSARLYKDEPRDEAWYAEMDRIKARQKKRAEAKEAEDAAEWAELGETQIIDPQDLEFGGEA